MTQLHHIIPRHTCKDSSCPGYNAKRKHTCGIDHPSNLYPLTHTQHALAHRNRAILTGDAHDWVTWKMMSGQMGKEEARRSAWEVGYRNRDTSYLKDPAYREMQRQISLSRGAKPPSFSGKTHKPEACTAIGDSMMGNKRGVGAIHIITDEIRLKQRLAHLGKPWTAKQREGRKAYDAKRPKKVQLKAQPFIWITNRVENRYLEVGLAIPQGYRRGRTMWQRSHDGRMI